METDPLSPDLGIHNRQVSLEWAATNAHWDFRTRETPQLITDTPTALDSLVWVQSPCPRLALIFFVQPSCPGVAELGSAAKSLKAPPGKAPKTIYPKAEFEGGATIMPETDITAETAKNPQKHHGCLVVLDCEGQAQRGQSALQNHQNSRLSNPPKRQVSKTVMKATQRILRYSNRVVADVWEKDVWDLQAKSGSPGACPLILHFIGKIALQKMSGKMPGSPRHPSCRHARPSDQNTTDSKSHCDSKLLLQYSPPDKHYPINSKINSG